MTNRRLEDERFYIDLIGVTEPAISLPSIRGWLTKSKTEDCEVPTAADDEYFHINDLGEF